MTPIVALTPVMDHARPGHAFDYVVVGGGTAGLVVAARLSEYPNTTVAVIEAGYHHVGDPLVDVPGFFGRAMGNPDYDWGFRSTPQTQLHGQTLPQAGGKILGGSSAINFMIWARASKKEYDDWEKLGAKGWNWDSLLPYFKKSESALSLQDPQAIYPGATKVSEEAFGAVHGRAGPIQPSYNEWYSNVTEPYVKTMNALGIPTNSEPYDSHAVGVYNCQNSIDRVKDVGTRSYSASTYYDLCKNRPNLKLFAYTQATKLVFTTSASGLRAIGVQTHALTPDGFDGTIFVNKEVILSAGAVQTPQLLELSGIGNKSILDKFGIETLLDLPGVGENLQDQILIYEDFELKAGFLTYDELRNNPTFHAEAATLYQNAGRGIFASQLSTLTFATTKQFASPSAAAAIQSAAQELARSPNLSPLAKAQYELQLDWAREDDTVHMHFIMYAGGGFTKTPPVPGKEYLTIIASHQHPFARGTVHIASADPLAAPAINPNYASNDVDLQSLLEGHRFVKKIVETDPLARFVVGRHSPAPDALSDADLLDYIKASVNPFYHHMGTAAMAARELGGVVDPADLKVYGTTNVRVVDASVIPIQFAAEPQATVFAIAERASDMIKGIVRLP